MNLTRFMSLSLMLVILLPASASALTASAEDIVNTERSPKRAQEECGFEFPEEQSYESQVISVRRKLKVEPGEDFRVKVFLRNDSNMPWFSNDSICLGPKMSLGTDKERDHDSDFFIETVEGVDDTNWESKNRIGMDQLRVDSGEIASFTFWAHAPETADIKKEFFTPVLAGIEWIDDSILDFEVIAGELDEDPIDLRKKLSYKSTSGSALDINLDGEKVLLVDLSEQKVYVMLDEEVVAEFRVSSGAAATPTPLGSTKISLKQEVRIGGKAPHYIMPNFMWFRAGGYGFHSLPSLRGNGDTFWTEAQDHIGRPASHGCVRLLPDDSDYVFAFADIGTTVTVQR